MLYINLLDFFILETHCKEQTNVGYLNKAWQCAYLCVSSMRMILNLTHE